MVSNLGVAIALHLLNGKHTPKQWTCSCRSYVKGTKQVEHLSPATTFTLKKLPLKSTLSCNTFPWTSHSFSLIIWQSRGPALISFYSENESKMRELARRVSACIRTALLYLCHHSQHKAWDSSPVTLAALQTGTVSAGIERPITEREVPAHMSYFLVK